ncbi:MAG: DEAD/DEAH box helicase [Propionibacteriales bacterium]|nr:DEAD/DEAH box helicase [Propionibacteriales bacterium]
MNQPAGGRVLPTPSPSTSTPSSADAASAGPRSSGFADLGLPKTLVKALAREGIVEPTPIQQAVLPSALAGRNVLGRARTGSGKTLSFGLPVLDQLAGGTRRPKAPRGLILVPTRELATQVQRALAPLAAPLHLRIMTVLGGTPINKQMHQLRDGVDLVVATPGRLADLVDRRACTLEHVEITVLDEADHLCDLGFFKPVDALVAMTPSTSQRLLLSATLDGDVDRLVRRHLPQHDLHEIESAQEPESRMEHHVLVTPRTEKLATASRLLADNPRTIVFARTRRGATRLARQLTTAGIEAVDLHGDLNQAKRERNLAAFSKGAADVIVATDIAARGIHVDDVKLVVHYDAPAEHKAYTHRSGRTARAGEAGTVVTMTTREDLRDVMALQAKAGVTARQHDAATAPSPLTPEALAASGTLPEPGSAGGRGGQRSGAQRSGGGQRSGGQRTGGGQRSGGQRPGGQRPGGQRSAGGQGRGAGTGGGQGRPAGQGGNRNRNRRRSGGGQARPVA